VNTVWLSSSCCRCCQRSVTITTCWLHSSSNGMELATGQSAWPGAQQQQLQSIAEDESISSLPLSTHSAVEMLHDSFFFIQFWYLRCCGCPWNRGRQHLATPLKTCHNTEAGFLQGGCSAYPPALYKSIIDIDNWAEHWRMQDQCSARHVHGTDKWPIFSHKTNQLVNRMVYLVLQHSELIWITNGNAVICVSECIRDVTKFDFEHCWTLNIFSVFEIHHILSWLISFFEFVV